MYSNNFLHFLFLMYLFFPNNQLAFIERYNHDRDAIAVQKIVHEHSEYLQYESIGYEDGYTMKFMVSPKHYTDVLRVADQTIGFVNYAIRNLDYLAFHFSRCGFIHLIGISKEHQRNGYGTLLLEHAIKSLAHLNAMDIILRVKTKNTIARSLYEKIGFQCLFRSYLPEDAPELTYVLPIDTIQERLS